MGGGVDQYGGGVDQYGGRSGSVWGEELISMGGGVDQYMGGGVDQYMGGGVDQYMGGGVDQFGGKSLPSPKSLCTTSNPANSMPCIIGEGGAVATCTIPTPKMYCGFLFLEAL
jgi:hypothetical protein